MMILTIMMMIMMLISIVAVALISITEEAADGARPTEGRLTLMIFTILLVNHKSSVAESEVLPLH